MSRQGYAILDSRTPEEIHAQSIADDQDNFQRNRYTRQKEEEFELEQAEELLQRRGEGGGAAGVRTRFNVGPNALRLGGIPVDPDNLLYSPYARVSAMNKEISQLKQSYATTMKQAHNKLTARSGMAEELSGLFGEDYYSHPNQVQLGRERDMMMTMVMRRVRSQKMREHDYVNHNRQRLQEVNNNVERIELLRRPILRDADAIFNKERADIEIEKAQLVIQKRIQKEIDMREQDPFYFL